MVANYYFVLLVPNTVINRVATTELITFDVNSLSHMHIQLFKSHFFHFTLYKTANVIVCNFGQS
jgi:hypothetical protein